MAKSTKKNEGREQVYYRPPEELVDVVERCGSILFGGVFNNFIQTAAIEFLASEGYLRSDEEVALPVPSEMTSQESAVKAAATATTQLSDFLKKNKRKYTWRCSTEVYELLVGLVASPEHRLPEPIKATDIRRLSTTTKRSRRLAMSAEHVAALDRCADESGGDRGEVLSDAIVYKANRAGLMTGTEPKPTVWAMVTGTNLTELAWTSLRAAQVLRTGTELTGVAGKRFERRLKSLTDLLGFSSSRLL